MGMSDVDAVGELPLRHANVVWLEAEGFAETGGWVNDSQFIDQMGSPYLLAHGIGEPVADAVTVVPLRAAGLYRLWVRTKDWVPEAHPGRFRVLLAGDECGHTFGESGLAGWRWEDGGLHELAGEVEVRLRDLSGYDGRCDVLLLTDDLGFVPPEGVDEIAVLRQRFGGVSREIATAPSHDVVVLGGGLAGCTAAVAAARNGARVALVQDRPVLGGNASSEILVPPVGVWPHGEQEELDPRETGLVEEYRTAGNQTVSEGKLYEKRLHRFVEQEPGLDLYLCTHVTGVEMAAGSPDRIAAVLGVDTSSGQRLRFPGTVFIDCTGDSAPSVAAGAEFRHGKEAKSMHDEAWAPDEPSPNTMGNGLKYATCNAGGPRPFAAPSWVFPFPSCESFRPGRHPRFDMGEAIGYQWQIELGGLRDTYADAEEIRDDLFRLIFGIWDHVKNRCPRFREAARDHEMVWLGHIAGKRENRRLIGDVVLTQNDIGQQTLFPDRVAYGGWIVDDHHSGGFFHDGSFGMHMDDPEHAYGRVEFSIPLRCLYSRNIANLMMAGRNISATHLAMSDTRVMLTCAVMGHAVGTAAALCVREGTTPRGVYQGHLAELQQQLLKEGATIPELRNRDPLDLARSATASASSEAVGGDGEALAARSVLDGTARAVEGSANAWVPCADTPGPHWLELAWDAPVAFNTVHIAFQTARLAPRRFSVEVRRDGEWRTVAEVERNRHRRHVLGLDAVWTDRLRVVQEQATGICEVRVYDEPDSTVVAARRAHATMRHPDAGPFLPFRVERTVSDLDGVVLTGAEAQRTGRWVTSTWAQPYVGDGYLHDGNADKGRKQLLFRPELPRPGRYEVRLSYVPADNRATNTLVEVRTTDGPVTVRINQRETPPIDRLFASLGTFELGDDAAVVVGNADTDGYVVADAIQFLAATEGASAGAEGTPLDLSACIRPTPRSAKFADPGHHTWGGSMLRDRDGTCHLLYSRWPLERGFNAWVTHSEIAHAVADHPLGPYRHVDVALPTRGAEFWDGLCTHNPTAIEVDGRYYLYYMGNTGDGQVTEGLNWVHRNNQRIGVAVADHPRGPWRRMGVPVIDVGGDPDAPDALMASNPSVTRRPDGGFLMVYKAVGLQRELPFGGPVVHCVATADSPTGPFRKHPGVVFTKEGVDFPAEDPWIWWQGERYRGIVKDNRGHFSSAGRSLILFESFDGLDWHPAQHLLVSRLEIPWEDGEWEQVSALERPQVWLDGGRPAVLFCAARDAQGASFNVAIPLGE